MKTVTTKTLQYFNWKGDLIDAPKDLGNIVATYADNVIVWSSSGRRHQVRYALQVKTYDTSIGAAEQFGYCVHHLEECNGKI